MVSVVDVVVLDFSFILDLSLFPLLFIFVSVVLPDIVVVLLALLGSVVVSVRIESVRLVDFLPLVSVVVVEWEVDD